MTDLDHDAEARMRQIAEQAWRSNQRRIAELTAIVAGWLADGSVPTESNKAARELTHQLIGSAGTFGHDRVSSLAREANDVLHVESPTPTELDRLQTLCATMTTELQQPPELDY